MNLDAARERLATVPDPEIPAVTLVELGIVRGLRRGGAYAHLQRLPGDRADR
jgi:metal-sulfur cluster biosynthetic enzyme